MKGEHVIKMRGEGRNRKVSAKERGRERKGKKETIG